MVFLQQSARSFEDMIGDQFDEMLLQSAKWPLVFTVVLHPFIVGQPFRLRGLRRALQHILAHRDRLWVTTPGEIARHCAAMTAGTIQGSCGLHRPFAAPLPGATPRASVIPLHSLTLSSQRAPRPAPGPKGPTGPPPPPPRPPPPTPPP